MGFLDFFKQNKNSKPTLKDSEWEHLYKTNFEQFWEMVIEEGDLTTLPDRISEPRSNQTLYGKEARDYFLYDLKQSVSPSKFNCDLKWKALLRYKCELKAVNKYSCMLDVIREYNRHIIY